jgi:hypothetical protein
MVSGLALVADLAHRHAPTSHRPAPSDQDQAANVCGN